MLGNPIGSINYTWDCYLSAIFGKRINIIYIKVIFSLFISLFFIIFFLLTIGLYSCY